MNKKNYLNFENYLTYVQVIASPNPVTRLIIFLVWESSILHLNYLAGPFTLPIGSFFISRSALENSVTSQYF